MLMNTTANMKLGDTVSGLYCDVLVTGVITAYDGSGYLYVKPNEPTEVLGSARDALIEERRSREPEGGIMNYAVDETKAGPR